MLVYYKKAGINAVLALILNTVLLMAALSYFGATLTLPGIAGVILTIGMAVDSNVLIFERIREELRTGKSIPAAVDAGFGKAWWTIVDTHVTTIVSCLFLFLFGTGPVKGFAVTLVIGLLANVFTAVFVSKAIFDWELSGNQQVTSAQHLKLTGHPGLIRKRYGLLFAETREQIDNGAGVISVGTVRLANIRFECGRAVIDGIIQKYKF